MRLCKAFTNGSSANTKLSKTQLHEMGKSRGFLGRLLLQLLKTKPLAKSVLIPSGLTAAASATDTAIHKKAFGSGATTLMISNEEKINQIKKTVKSLKKSSLMIKGVSEIIKNEAKEQKERFLGNLLGTLGDSLKE